MQLFPRADEAGSRVAVRFPEGELTYAELFRAARAIAARLEPGQRVAVVTEPCLETVVALVGALLANATVVPVNPKLGRLELDHLLADSAPAVSLGPADVELRSGDASGDEAPADPEDPALIVYTSGTSGPPKGVVLPRRALVTNLDALGDVWGWSERDTLVHGLPLFHVHGLILGTIGQLRLGGTLHHVGRFTPEAICAAVAAGGTLVFGVPTMYRRLADLAEEDASAREALAAVRLLVSGSAALSRADEERIGRVTGRRIVQRYGLSETIMNTAAPAAAGARPGSVGPALPGVTIELLDDRLEPIEGGDGETLGQVAVRGPNLFSGYLNRPDATAAAFHGDAFLTGDVATRDADGWLRIAGRMSTDLIKTGGYKVGAGEVESALSEHPNVDDVAVVGVEDADLGERIEAFVVLRRAGTTEDELTRFVGELIASHKRPRRIRFVDELPRNAMGKIVKKTLREAAERDAS